MATGWALYHKTGQAWAGLGWEQVGRAEPIRPRWCDHCRTDRFRNDTYLVENGSERKQVGSTDLTILGHDDWLIMATTPTIRGPGTW